jgi:hypothetical protein
MHVAATGARVFNPHQPDRTGGVRYRFTGRFGRKPVETEKFEFQTKFLSASGSNRYTDWFNRFDRFPIV